MSLTASFKTSLGLLDATMIVAGGMIGSGIFIVSTEMTTLLGSSGWLIMAWVLSGLLTLIAAVSYGELSGMYPKAGGQYVYLREAYNPLIAFLFGWSLFTVIQTGTIAAVAVAFAKFTAYIFPSLGTDNILLHIGGFKVSASQLVGIVCVVVLTYINTLGVNAGKTIQTTLTLIKLVSLFALIVAGFLIAAKADIWNSNWMHAWEVKHFVTTGDGGHGHWQQVAGIAVIPLFASALVGSLFSSDAWNNVTFIAGEIRRPQRNIGLSLFLGTLIVTVIYIAANLSYLSTLTLDEIAFAQDGRVAISASQKIFNNAGTLVIAVMIMISTFGCNNGLILSGARVYYTMANDGLFFKKTGTLNKNGVPAIGLWVQCIWASLLCLSGTYSQLLTYVVFVVLIFYMLTLAGIFILRKKQPTINRPYKAFGYPVLPILYCVLASAICIALFIFQPMQTWPGLIIVVSGIPIYYFAVRKKSKTQ